MVIASSPFETKASGALVSWIRRTLSPSRIVAINTHFHLDGTGGNEAFHQAGAAIYASRLTATLLREQGPALLREVAAEQRDRGRKARLQRLVLVAPDHLFDPDQARAPGLPLRFGAEEVRIIYPGPAHARDNVVVYLPSRGVVFGGCMVKGEAFVGFVGDADLDRWEESLRTVEALGAKVVVPGHGPVGGPELFPLTASVVQKARADARAAARKAEGDKK